MKRTAEPKPDIHYRPAEARALADGSAGFAGHASTWWVVDSYGTAMKPGAFAKTLKERGQKIPLLWQHDSWQPIGKPDELKEDSTGLAFTASVVTETRAGAEAMALLRADTPLGMSFGFQTIKSRAYEEADEQFLDFSVAPTWAKDPNEREWLRIIEEVKLWEISLVTFPANELVDISNVRSLFDQQTFPHILDSIRTGALDGERAALVEQLVAAWSERAGAGQTTPLEPTTARRALHAEFALIEADLALEVYA